MTDVCLKALEVDPKLLIVKDKNKRTPMDRIVLSGYWKKFAIKAPEIDPNLATIEDWETYIENLPDKPSVKPQTKKSDGKDDLG